MAFKAEVREVLGGSIHERNMAISFSDIMCSPEVLLSALVTRIADEYCRNHYAEIEALIDPKVVAACVSADLGARVKDDLMREIHRVNEVASQALRKVKRL